MNKSVSITTPQSICSMLPENMGNPCPGQTSCTLSRKIARLVCNVGSSLSVGFLSVRRELICVCWKLERVLFCCRIQFYCLVSTIISNSWIADFHSGTFVFEKTFSLAVARKLQNVPRVGYSYANDMYLGIVLALLCTKCCLLSVMVLHLTLRRKSQFVFVV